MNTSTRRTRVLAVGAAVAAALVLWLVAAIFDIDLKVDMNNGQPPMVIGIPLIVSFSLLFALMGWGSLAVLERFTQHARPIWTTLATLILLLSFLPIVSAIATTGTKLILSLIHIAVAAVLIPALPRHRKALSPEDQSHAREPKGDRGAVRSGIDHWITHREKGENDRSLRPERR